MKTILIPTDFSENSWKALEYAVGLFRDIPCNLYLFHVGTLRQSPVRGNTFAIPEVQKERPAEQEFKELLQRIKGLPHTSKHRFMPLQAYGNLVSAIRKAVNENKVDLIVMGTKGASGIRQKVVGSNTGDVITKVQCKLLVVPEDAEFNGVKEVVFPTNYQNFYTHSILETVSEILLLTGAAFRILYVSRPEQPLNPVQKQHRKFLAEYLGEAFPDKFSFHTLTNANVNQGIENFIVRKKGDMIVMVAKNLNFFQKLFFDTIIEKMSFHTKVPLLVLHE